MNVRNNGNNGFIEKIHVLVSFEINIQITQLLMHFNSCSLVNLGTNVNYASLLSTHKCQYN